MDIRPARAEDLGQIAKYDRHIPPERLEACIRSGFVDVLCDGGQIVGVLRWSLFWQSIPFLDLLYLDDALRGRGWGRRMMAAWESALAARGFRHVMLSTQADETAQFFYEKLGYRRAGAFLPPDQDAEELIYRKELNI